MVHYSLNIKACCSYVIWEKQDQIWAQICCIPKNMHSRTPMVKILLRQFSKSSNGWQKVHFYSKLVYASTWIRFQIDTNWACAFMWHFLCGVETVTCFVNVHLHWNVSNLKSDVSMQNKISTLPSVDKILWTPMYFPNALQVIGCQLFFTKKICWLSLFTYFNPMVYCTAFFKLRK